MPWRDHDDDPIPPTFLDRLYARHPVLVVLLALAALVAAAWWLPGGR